AFVGQVGFVDDAADLFQRRVGLQAERDQRGLERAPAPVMPERGPAHVKRRGAGGEGGGGGGEDELGIGVDEAADQPGTGGPVDMHTRAGRPLHARAPAVSSAARCSTARRAASRCGQVKKSRPWMRCSSRRSRATARRRAAASAVDAAAASAATATYSAATVSVIRLTTTAMALVSRGRPSQRVASPPWPVT